jgi:N-acetylglucosaminyldiphosphoundecaprenol N-acetyl-beta-D-mannosaminyltransferase
LEKESRALSQAELSPEPGKPRVPVLGGRITPLDLDGTVELLRAMIKRRTRGYVCVANVHTTTLAARDEHFRKVLNGAAVVVADGMPVVWRVRAAGYPQAGRVYGADFVKALCAAGIGEGLRHGFLGGVEGVGDAIVAHLRRQFPALQIAGVWNPGIIREGEPITPYLLNAINESRCDVLWVGLGAPKQEIWMAQHHSLLAVPVSIGVGQAFDILAGRTVQPPAWIGRHGLEWLYRLVHNPRRHWKRYLYYNSLFLWYLFRESMGLGRASRSPRATVSSPRTRRSESE